MGTPDNDGDRDDDEGADSVTPPMGPPAVDPNGPRLVIGTTAGQQWFDYDAAGGAKTFSRCGMGLFDPDDVDGTRSDFFMLHQDTGVERTLLVGLGVPVPFHLNIARMLGSAFLARTKPADVADRLKFSMPIDPTLVRTRLVLPADGPGVFVPREWKGAIRKERDGYIVAGLLPGGALFGSETRETAPPLHSQLREDDRQQAPARRRKS